MRLLIRFAALGLVGNLLCASLVWAQSSQTTRSTTTSSRSSTYGGGFSSASGTRSSGSSARFGTPTNAQASDVQAGLESRIQQMMPGNSNLRSSRGPQDFVGADSGDVVNLMGFANSSQTQRSTSRGRSSSQQGARSNYSNRRQTYTRNSTRSGQTAEVQPVLRLGFGYAASSPSNLDAKLTSRLERGSGGLSELRVEFDGGVATLNGAVASEHDRELAEQLLALEPGVRRVENRLTVGPSAESPPHVTQ